MLTRKMARKKYEKIKHHRSTHYAVPNKVSNFHCALCIRFHFQGQK